MIPSLLVVTFVVYVVCRIGWNPVASFSKANPRASQKQIDEFVQANGLYPGVKGYTGAEWLGKFLQGPALAEEHQGNGGCGSRCGTCLQHLRPPAPQPSSASGPASAYGILASRHPGGWLDTLSTPALFHRGIPLRVRRIFQLVFAVQLGWLPPAGVSAGHEGFDLVEMINMILPVTVVAIQTIGQYARYRARCSTCRRPTSCARTLKGIPERRVWRHSVRTLILIVTIIALDIGS
jgi:ABC-type dipeptide/oligopeptide/nickel transport system permease component